MDLVIRHVKEQDHEAVHEILTSPHVLLTRLGLFAFTDNTHAVWLYERVGFVIEGTMPRMGFGAGVWMDAYMMGRLRDP
jgi:RimJ/RimL family protein N-acetyltransferase